MVLLFEPPWRKATDAASHSEPSPSVHHFWISSFRRVRVHGRQNEVQQRSDGKVPLVRLQRLKSLEQAER
jgi:hypothetical protein